MDLDKYAVVSDINHVVYEFLSERPYGTIKKVVFYQEIGDNIYNLAFGDWDEERQRINDRVRSNNNDRDKVLATVASTVTDFIKYHPNAQILAQGSTPSRTRLYQMGILGNMNAIGNSFDIQGFYKGNWEIFKEGRNYEVFAVKAK